MIGYKYRGIAQLVEYWSPKPWVVGSSPSAPAKKIQVARLGFFHLCRKAQHRLRGTRNIISSEARTSLPLAAQMNDVALRANDVLRNDVGLRPMMLRFAQTELSRSLGALK